MSTPFDLKKSFDPNNETFLRLPKIMRDRLQQDVQSVEAYRSKAEPTTQINFDLWMSRYLRTDLELDVLSILYETLEFENDFMHTTEGINVLKNRYLLKGEPIQFGFMRIAIMLAKVPEATFSRHDGLLRYINWPDGVCDLRLVRIFYRMLSGCMLHVSSILAAASATTAINYGNDDGGTSADGENEGEACRLLVNVDTYDQRLIKQLKTISETVSLGVGVGYGASKLPLNGKRELGKVQSNFLDIVHSLNAATYLYMHERRPKTAIYLHIDCDTVLEALNSKSPMVEPRLNGVMFGLLVSDYFMRRVRDDKQWTMFPGDTRFEGESLRDYAPHTPEYQSLYERMEVARDSIPEHQQISAFQLFELIGESFMETGSPYIVWIDRCNQFNNQEHLGPIETLNLCAEITNFASPTLPSSCTLISANMAVFNEKKNKDLIRECVSYMREIGFFSIDWSSDSFLYCDDDDVGLIRHAYIVGYMGVVALNNVMGRYRTRREIAVSPLGVYDAAVIKHWANFDKSKIFDVCASVSEYMYRGTIDASCDYAHQFDVVCANYEGSYFQRGVPQWKLRDPSACKPEWTKTCENMKTMMANSLLTAQAPTATTSCFVGAMESVTLPMAAVSARESSSGRSIFVPYGVLYYWLKCANSTSASSNEEEQPLMVKFTSADQLAMYKASLPFVDQSQSAMFAVPLSKDPVLSLIINTWYAGLKTGIYYINFLKSEIHRTINGCDSCSL